jgi:hypothetical protein
MDYKLTLTESGEAEFITKAGTSFVKSTMNEGMAKGIIETAKKLEPSDRFSHDGFGIMTNDGEYYFKGKITAEKPEKKTPGKKK